jgi:hypothetical protein
MIKTIREDIYESRKNNNHCELYIGKETFKRVYEEAHPEDVTPKTIKWLQDIGVEPTLVGVKIKEADFDYGYYLKQT